MVFGPGEGGNFTRLAEALRKRIFVYPGRRDTIKGCGYVGDLLKSIQFALGLNNVFFLYNFCYPRPYTIEDICTAFHEVAGYPNPALTIPLGPMCAAAWLFEIFSKLGVETGIHRGRIMKLVQSTHITPKTLILEGYQWQTDLLEGLRRWQVTEPAGDFI